MRLKEITAEYATLDIKYQGEKYSISVGDCFGRLQVTKLVQYIEGNTKRKGCICKCACGNYIGPSRLYMLLSGDLISCGCYSREIHSQMLKESNYRHGDSVRDNRSKLYMIWAAMMNRTNSTGRDDSKYYSEKGITVCAEWKDYRVFKEWALSHGYKDGLSIDRKDNSKGYNPDNCRFIELKMQNSNKTCNRYITCKGTTHTITEWCRIIGKSWTYIDSRLKAGRSVGEALGYEK